jgi:hypothetical protein
MSRLVTLAVALLVLASGTVGTWPITIRAGVRPQQDGLAIHGVVRLPGTREPVSGARVKIRDFATKRPVEISGNEETITTGIDGRFSFADLAPGRYLVAPVFPGDPDGLTHIADGRIVELAENGLPRDVEVWWIEPVSELSGRILNAEGEPVVGVCVTARSVLWYAGSPLMAGSGPSIQGFSCFTDEEGRFRIGATPGRYYLHLRIPDDGTLVGTLVAPPQYYPGTFLPDFATPVTVVEGVDLNGLDVSLAANTAFHVSFRVRLPEVLPGLPEPLSAYVDNADFRSSIVRGDSGLGMVAWVGRLAGPGFIRELASNYQLVDSGEGSYSLPPLPPGQYEMLLTYPNDLKNRLRSEFDINWKPFDPIARIQFEIEDSDIDLGTLPSATRASIPGRVVLRRSAQGVQVEPVELPSVGLEDIAYLLGSESRSAEPADDGTFLIEDAYPGSFTAWIQTDALPPGWYVESFRSGGVDLTMDELLVGGGAVSPIQIVIANDAGRVAGVVRNPDGQLVPDARVILVPPLVRRGPITMFPAVVADATGSFLLEGLRPGDYRLLALDGAGREEHGIFWQAPNFLRQYELRGDMITVDPGARLTINPEAIPLVE